MSIYGRELFVLFYTCGAWRYLIDGKVTNSSAYVPFWQAHKVFDFTNKKLQ